MIIDISHHQKDFPFDVAKNEVDFWIIRATHGIESIDKEWADNVAWLADHPDEKFAVYGYFYYGSFNQHKSEMANLIKRVKEIMHLPNFTKIVFLDFEHTTDVGKYRPLSIVNRVTATDWLLDDYKDLKSLYLIPGLYASREWLKNKLIPSRFPDDMVIWVADYSGEPLKTKYPYRYDLHQYTSRGRLTSTTKFAGALDLDALNPKTTFAVLKSLMTKPIIFYKQGSYGEEVGRIQQILKDKGYFEYPKITNYYGRITKSAVKKFQKAHGLVQDGIVGPITYSALYAMA